MDSVSLRAPAKINLGLDVIGKREDGYHEVRMIMQSVHLYDRVDIKRTRSRAIRVETNLYYLPADENNLAYKAAKLLKDEFKIRDGVFITLQKFIPVAAGLAGGSADAAAVLIGMNRIFRLGLNQKQLMAFGRRIGADVPFCVMRGTALAEGIGEILTPLPSMPKCPVLIAKPAASVSTRWVYENLILTETTKHPDIDAIADAVKKKNLKLTAENMGNILETVTVPKNPVIEEIKRNMKANGALNAIMSGSGPSVFGLFQNEKEIHRAYDALKSSGLAKNLYATEIFTSGNRKQNRE